MPFCGSYPQLPTEEIVEKINLDLGRKWNALVSLHGERLYLPKIYKPEIITNWVSSILGALQHFILANIKKQ